jgi:hypothetical protein
MAVFIAECRFHLLGGVWERLRPEVTSPIERATMVSYKCSVHVSVYCVPFTSYERFLFAVKSGGLLNSAVR